RAAGGAHQDAGAQEGAGLPAVHVGERALVKLAADARQVDRLAAGHAAAARASNAHRRACNAGATLSSVGVRTSNASACMASPASIAWATPKRTCTVGLPRRKTSSSMHGRSSWTSE